MRRLLLIMVAMLGVLPASAEPAPASKTSPLSDKTLPLFEWCTSEPQTIGDVSCTSYVTGFVHALFIMSAASPSPAPELCLPRNFAPSEARTIYIRAMRSNPQLQELPPGIALWVALTNEIPCGKNSK